MSDPKPDGPPLKRVDSYQWPSGHVGHLTEGQRGALEAFKKLCQEKGYYNPGGDGHLPSHDDETLLRYLRARKFIPIDGFGQFKDTEDWRQENDIDRLYETIDIDEYEQTRKLYPQWTGRRDKRGIPFYVFEVAHLQAKDINAYQNDKDRKKEDGEATVQGKAPRKMLRLFALYENLCRFVLPLCSVIPTRPNSETPISQSSNIVDISKVGFRQFWNLRNHLQDASKLATAHYPETLDRIFIVGAPGFFPTVWDWAKKWFDPITVSKILILSSSNTLSTLEKFVDIESIPKKYGGKLDWSFGDMPALDPDIANSFTWKEDIHQKGHRTLPIGPVKWQQDDKGDLVAVAIGTENGKLRDRTIAGIHPESGVARLSLNPGRRHTSSLIKAANTTAQIEEKLANGSVDPMPSDPTLDTGKTVGSAVPDTSRAGTYTVPLTEPKTTTAAPPPDARQGTSHTRFEQQAMTHAKGQVSAGTPEVREDGQGSEHAVMEPRTVGQAPKETPLYQESDEKPSLLEQAQQTAAQLPATVLSAVGLGGKKEEGNEGQATQAEDPRVDNMEDKHVEEFIRSETMSKPASAE